MNDSELRKEGRDSVIGNLLELVPFSNQIKVLEFLDGLDETGLMNLVNTVLDDPEGLIMWCEQAEMLSQ